MITFDHLVNELLKMGYTINEKFTIPDDIPLISIGHKVEYITENKEIPIIFCKIGYHDRNIMALVGDVGHKFIPIDSFTMIEKINKSIIKETMIKCGITVKK